MMTKELKCCVCNKTNKESALITMMGETKCADCMRNKLREENYNPQKEFANAVKSLKKRSFSNEVMDELKDIFGVK